MRRLQARISQADIARVLGCSRPALSQFEKRGAAKPETAKRYENALATLIAQRRGSP